MALLDDLKNIDLATVVDQLSVVAQQLEGPYRWYIISGMLLMLTAFVTRFIFKTFKWFFLVVLMGTLVFGIMWAIGRLAGLA